ncbi:MAG: hypothetical protein JKY53_03005 [Flavobacteriales bacterium]|nr:hypothetical protein [Flavobacteriales bacterium]
MMLKQILLLVVVLNLFQRPSMAQFTVAEQTQIDSLNNIISSVKSHDTSIVSAYVALSEVLYVSNIDTLKSLYINYIWRIT